MKYRKLRIAWSVVWGVVALLTCVLWMRSYSHVTMLWRMNPSNLLTAIISESGDIWIDRYSSDVIEPHGWQLSDKPQLASHVVIPNAFVHGQFRWNWTPSQINLKVPHWLLTSLAAALSTGPWLCWRFSLRTLLIATTLIAVVLGLVVW
jgi:hypothetical protein